VAVVPELFKVRLQVPVVQVAVVPDQLEAVVLEPQIGAVVVVALEIAAQILVVLVVQELLLLAIQTILIMPLLQLVHLLLPMWAVIKFIPSQVQVQLFSRNKYGTLRKS
jgi:hypothetical protein